MKCAVKDDPKKLHFDRGPEFPGISPNPVDADIDLRNDRLSGSGQRESDYIGIEVMLKKLAVDFQEPVIGHKNISQLGQPFPFLLKQGDERCLDPPAVPQAYFLFKMKPDSRGDCHNFTAPR